MSVVASIAASRPFPWFSILRPDGARPHSQSISGFGEALIVMTSGPSLSRYREAHQMWAPAVQFDSPSQLQVYLRSWSSLSGLLVDPESNEQRLIPVRDVTANDSAR